MFHVLRMQAPSEEEKKKEIEIGHIQEGIGRGL
jgi:hypothetical protein